MPCPNNKKIVWSEDLLPLYLIRYTSSKDIYLKDTDQIDPTIINNIPAKQFGDLSTNLLGKSKIEDIYIEVTNKDFSKAWVEGESVNIPLFDKDFCMKEERGYLFWKIQEIASYSIETEMAKDDKKYNLSLKLRHTPLKCNFWHFSIIAFVNDTDVDSLEISDNQKKKLWRTVRVKLSNIVVGKILDFSTLPKIHYVKP
ncbi:hypothetical protein FACS1894177_09500 [Bacteroidia bacterium]|nr:hypothetical protein FACS1894177_09500 [Bacteroidia bacterium]